MLPEVPPTPVTDEEFANLPVLDLATFPLEPCCTYRDHQSGECFCDQHRESLLHPFGSPRGPRIQDRYSPITGEHWQEPELPFEEAV